jgi:hypothetical protein
MGALCNSPTHIMTAEQAWFTDDEQLEASDSETTDEKDGSETQDSSSEKQNETETGADQPKETEEEVPFHKHPRFKAITHENRELKAQIEEFNQWRQTIDQKVQQPTQDAPVPDWFATAFGDNPEAYAALQQFEAEREEQLKTSILQKIEADKSQKKQQDNQIKQFIDGEITKLKDEGNTFDENELKKVVLENKLFDDSGKLNFKAGLMLLKASRSTTTEAKKELASKTAPTSGGSPVKSDMVTPTELRKATSALDFLKRL